jgi:6-phosphofructokinase 1
LTFGFMTAVNTATDALEKLHTTAESHHRIMVLEVMGRYAGWIALHSGIAGSVDVILIPEIPYNLARVGKKIQERKSKGKTFSIIVAAEGAHAENQEMVVCRQVEGSPDPVRLGGVGQRIATDLEKLTGNEARVTVLGHLQRGGKPSAFDRILATRYGVAAVHLAAKGEFNRMVSLQGQTITSVPLAKEVTKLKKVPPGGELVQAAREIGIEFGN